MVKGSVGVLEGTVTVKQWGCVWIGLQSSFECVEYNRVVVAVTNNIRNDTSVIQVEDCTQIDFVDFNTFIPFELCNIGKPFHIWLWCMKITLEYIFSHILQIGSVTGTAVVAVLNGRLDLLCLADSQNALVVYIHTEVVF